MVSNNQNGNVVDLLDAAVAPPARSSSTARANDPALRAPDEKRAPSSRTLFATLITWLDELIANCPNQTIQSLRTRTTERWIHRERSRLLFLSCPFAKAAIEGGLHHGFGAKRLMDPPMA